jgi:alpha-tubulin suppressor-like RCC1 family protein
MIISMCVFLAPVVTAPAVAQEGNYEVSKYDLDKSGFIEKSEAITAINDYLLKGTTDKPFALSVMNSYLLRKAIVVGSSTLINRCIFGTCFTTTPMVAAGYYHVVGLKSNGKVIAAGGNSWGQCNVDSWSNITQVAAGAVTTVGLKNDGTVVVATGPFNNNSIIINSVSSWTNIKQVAVGALGSIIGLKSDGKVVVAGDLGGQFLDLGSWPNNIIRVEAGVGVTSDGTVVLGWRDSPFTPTVSSWTHIKQALYGDDSVLGLKSDGTMVTTVGAFTYDNRDGQLNVSSWTGITQVAEGIHFTVGLKSNGTVVAVGDNGDGQCNVASWTSITQVAAGDHCTVGVKLDGTVVAAGTAYATALGPGLDSWPCQAQDVVAGWRLK